MRARACVCVFVTWVHTGLRVLSQLQRQVLHMYPVHQRQVCVCVCVYVECPQLRADCTVLTAQRCPRAACKRGIFSHAVCSQSLFALRDTGVWSVLSLRRQWRRRTLQCCLRYDTHTHARTHVIPPHSRTPQGGYSPKPCYPCASVGFVDYARCTSVCHIGPLSGCMAAFRVHRLAAPSCS